MMLSTGGGAAAAAARPGPVTVPEPLLDLLCADWGMPAAAAAVAMVGAAA